MTSAGTRNPFPYTQSQAGQLVWLAALTIVLAVVGLVRPTLAPLSAFSIVLTLGGFYLRVRTLVVLYVLVASVIFFVVVNRLYAPTPGNFFVVVTTGILAMAYALSRRDIGLQGRAPDSMLLDLRDRLLAQGQIPPLPDGWGVETVFSAAEWQRFTGDFLVAAHTDPEFLDVALVDVSGKGPSAGTRALSLSGAFSGLIGALEADRFLPEANDYLIRQGWEEGFATAVYVHLDLLSGAYTIRYAGHPPAGHYRYGAGRWELQENLGGPALGLLDGVEFMACEGILAPGDALMLYTDGLVEEPGRDVSLGIDQLMGQAERQLHRAYDGAADRIMHRSGGSDDDRAVVLIWRERGAVTTGGIPIVPKQGIPR